MFLRVIVDITHSEVDKIFEYTSGNYQATLGSRVVVPFGNKKIEGIVIGTSEKSDYPVEKIKPILGVLEDTPALTEESIMVMERVVSTCYVNRATALRLFLPSEMRKGRIKAKFTEFLVKSDTFDLDIALSTVRKGANRQKDLLLYLAENEKVKLSFANETFSSSAVKTMLSRGFCTVVEEQVVRLPYKDLSATKKSVDLTPKQLLATKSIKETDKTVTLLYGVTGSGKTEVYLNLIYDVIKQGKTAIMLCIESVFLLFQKQSWEMCV